MCDVEKLFVFCLIKVAHFFTGCWMRNSSAKTLLLINHLFLFFILSENPCPITFEKPHAVKENDTITLTCSTSSSCSLSLKITDVSQLPSTPLSNSQQNDNTHKSTTTVSSKASWQDNGRVFSCQTQDNTDKYLIRNVSINVKCKFRNIGDFIHNNF